MFGLALKIFVIQRVRWLVSNPACFQRRGPPCREKKNVVLNGAMIHKIRIQASLFLKSVLTVYNMGRRTDYQYPNKDGSAVNFG